MALKFFSIHVFYSSDAETELNNFLASNRLLNVERKFVDRGENSFWAICVDYQPTTTAQSQSKKSRIDYREVLSPEQFAIFVKLRDVRTEIAQKDAIPVYTIFTNEQLAAMVTEQVRTKEDLATISGVGDARVAKYGEQFLTVLSEKTDATSS